MNMQDAVMIKGKENEEEDEELRIWDCGSPLYDSYELASVSHLIERHLTALPSLGGSRRFITGTFSHHPSSVVSSDMITRGSAVREGKGPNSMVGGFGGFMGMKRIWKRRVVLGDQRKQKTKKKKTGFTGFFSLIGLWRKKDIKTGEF